MKGETMTEAKHTPGPWHVREGIHPDYLTGIYAMTDENGESQIAEALVNSVNNESYSYPEDAEANAYLIAAAPELLEALKTTQSALKAAYKHAYDNQNSAGADIIGAMLHVQAEQNQAVIAKAQKAVDRVLNKKFIKGEK